MTAATSNTAGGLAHASQARRPDRRTRAANPPAFRHFDPNAIQQELKEAGLDYYNHNLDTSEAFYDEIVTTRGYAERLDTLRAVRAAGLKVCCGGILGMGKSREDRVALLSAPG